MAMTKDWIVLRPDKNGEPRGYERVIEVKDPGLDRLIYIQIASPPSLRMMESDDQYDEMALWKLLRKKEIYRLMKEEMTDYKVNWNDPKLKLMRQWMTYGDPFRDNNRMYWERFIKFNARDLMKFD